LQTIILVKIKHCYDSIILKKVTRTFVSAYIKLVVIITKDARPATRFFLIVIN